MNLAGKGVGGVIGIFLLATAAAQQNGVYENNELGVRFPVPAGFRVVFTPGNLAVRLVKEEAGKTLEIVIHRQSLIDPATPEEIQSQEKEKIAKQYAHPNKDSENQPKLRSEAQIAGRLKGVRMDWSIFLISREIKLSLLHTVFAVGLRRMLLVDGLCPLDAEPGLLPAYQAVLENIEEIPVATPPEVSNGLEEIKGWRNQARKAAFSPEADSLLVVRSDEFYREVEVGSFSLAVREARMSEKDGLEIERKLALMEDGAIAREQVSKGFLSYDLTLQTVERTDRVIRDGKEKTFVAMVTIQDGQVAARRTVGAAQMEKQFSIPTETVLEDFLEPFQRLVLSGKSAAFHVRVLSPYDDTTDWRRIEAQSVGTRDTSWIVLETSPWGEVRTFRYDSELRLRSIKWRILRLAMKRK